MLFRIGLNLGDVIHDETRIYGDGINVAARLEGIAEPGGICISRQVFEQVNRAVKADFQALGPRVLKNIAQPVDVFALAPPHRGARPRGAVAGAVDLQQQVHFCSAPDGVQLAYSVVGQGPPLMKTGQSGLRAAQEVRKPLLLPELSADLGVHTRDRRVG